MVKSKRYRKKRSFKSRTRKQKLWNQKGCSHTKCKSCRMCHMCQKRLKGGDSSIAPLSVLSNGTVGVGGGCGCSNNYIMGGSTCGTCMNENCSCAGPDNMMGGSGIFNGAIPGPIVGDSWGPIKWPGANGIGGDANILPYNTYKPVDISRQMALRGGKRSKGKKQLVKRKKSMKGGGIMPQDLLNLGRDFAFNMESAYNSIRGIPAPVNPLPYKDQLMAEATRY